MKKKWIAILSLTAMLLGLLTAVKPVEAEAASGSLRVGYSTVSIDPIDKEGKYRQVDYTAVLESSGYAALKTKLAAAGVTLENPVFTVPTVSADCDGNGTTDDGYFSVPLAGYGTTYERMSVGKMDDNGDGKVDSKDGLFITCIAITDEQGSTMLFYTMDLISSPNGIIADARKNIQAALQESYGRVLQDHIMFTASHTHSSPDIGIDNTASPLVSNAAQRAYIAMLHDRFVQAAQAAMADRSEVTVQKGEIQATNMNGTRHYNAYEEKRKVVGGVNLNQGSASWVQGDNFGRYLPSDELVDKSPVYQGSNLYNVYEVSHVSQSNQMVQLVQFTPTDGKTPIVMVNFRAHPKLNSTSSMQYGMDNKYCTSPDYVGPLREKLLKYGYRAAYIQGAAGNQNTWSYIDDAVLGPRATNTYTWMMQRHSIDVTSSTTYDCYNDRMAFIKYTSPSTGKSYNTQTGYSYGCRLADYVLVGLEEKMSDVTVAPIQTEQYYFSAAPQVYSDGLKAAVAAYDADTTTAKKFPYQYKHTDGKYYNLNSKYHANAVRGRNTNADLIDAKLELNCITIGNLAFLTAPNELYDRYNLSGNQVSGNLWDNLNDEGFGTPVFIGYSNGAEGYVPNVAAYEYNRANNDKGSVKRAFSTVYDVYGVGAYEANTSKFAPGAGEELCKTFEKMLRSVKNSQRGSTCPMCGATGVQWEALGAPGATQYVTGHYYLADDLDYYAGTNCFQKTIYNGDSVCIDMNGRTIRNSSNVTGRAFYVGQGATLRLMNGTVHGRGHQRTGENGGVIFVDKTGSLYLKNVDIVRDMEEGQATNNGGAIYLNIGAQLNVEGGSITGGSTEYYGGAVYANSSSVVNLKDTVISGGSASAGGNLYFYTKATATLDNVTLKEGTATGNGDNLIAFSANVHIKGDSVLEGECYFSGGTPKISDGVHAWKSPDGVNIKLTAGTKLTFGTLNSTARIGITGRTMVTDATALPYTSQIFADSGYLDTTFSYGIFAGEFRGCACRGKAVGKHTCQIHAWTYWDATDSLPTVGNYYLNKNVTLTEQAGVHSTLRLDLNGKIITRKVGAPEVPGDKPVNTRVWNYGGDRLLSITDSAGNGVVKRDISALSATEVGKITDFGLIACLSGNAKFQLFGGILNGLTQATTGGGTVAGTVAGTTVEIYGGTVKGVAGVSGGGIFSKGAVLLCGGTVTAGKATKGGGVYMNESGMLTLTGDACVTGNFAADGTTTNNIYASAAQLTVSGVYQGTAGIQVSSPAEGKQVGLASGANLTNAKLSVDGNNTYQFYVNGNQLKLTTKAMEAFITYQQQTTYYESLEAAISAYRQGQTLHLMRDITRDVTFTADTQLELSGCSITGKITLTDATLQVQDSTTADYTVADGAYGKLPAMAGVTAAQGYIMVTEGNTVSFHKLGLDLTSVSLRPENGGIYYSGKFCADEQAVSLVAEYGIALQVGSVPTAQQILADTTGKMHYACKNPTSGTNASGVLLQNILSTKNTYAVNKYNAGLVVYGVAYVKTTDGTVILGSPVSYSLRAVIQAADGQWQDLTGAQKKALFELCKTYDLVTAAWELKNVQQYIAS